MLMLTYENKKAGLFAPFSIIIDKSVDFNSLVFFSAKQIINRYVKIVRKFYQRSVICLSLTILVPAYRILIHIQIHSKFEL